MFWGVMMMVIAFVAVEVVMFYAAEMDEDEDLNYSLELEPEYEV